MRKRHNATTMSDHDQPVADNLHQKDFTAARPNQRWVGYASERRTVSDPRGQRSPPRDQRA